MGIVAVLPSPRVRAPLWEGKVASSQRKGALVTPLYAFSLVPVMCVALLLFFTVIARPRLGLGIAAFAVTIAAWTLSLLLTFFEPLAPIGQRFAASGAFVVAGYLHLAWDYTSQKSYAIVWLTYFGAALCTAAGAIFPGLLYDPISLTAGSMFWPAMGLAVVGASLPLWIMARAYREAKPDDKRPLAAFVIGGIVMYIGAWSNAMLIASGYALPYGLFLILGALFVIATIISESQAPEERKLLENSLLYSSLTALVWAGFLFGVIAVISGPGASLSGPYGIGALFLLCMAAIAFEPLRRVIFHKLATRLFPERAPAERLAKALVVHEERADQAERLAELGAFTSAIAHEVRNPLGVIGAHVKLLERADAPVASITAIKQQLERASSFVDELVQYGRPRPLELRQISLPVFLQLAISTAKQGRARLAEAVTVDLEVDDGVASIEGDQGQLLQVIVILIDNAILAMHEHPPEEGARVLVSASRIAQEHVEIAVEDNGPGIPEDILGRIFEPFVTGRGRDHEVGGTGLGLAIAARIAERHAGALEVGEGDALRGARLVLTLPVKQSVPGMHASAAPEHGVTGGAP